MDAASRAELQRLLTRLGAGDRSAFDPAFDRVWPLARAYALRVLRESALAEDAAQLALMKVLARASDFDPERDALAWVLGITAYECRTLRQKQRRRREVAWTERVHAREVDPEEHAMARELEREALAMLGSLSPEDSATLLALAHGEPVEVPRATFRKRVERAIARLRLKWRERHGLD